jgi:NFU1 iron-sulfur cluster scaffold homolog, mitochondrial
MFIQTEDTPNPDSLKFVPSDVVICEKGTRQFKSKATAKKGSPLAFELFKVDGVKSVFFGHDFITINKNEKTQWPDIKTEIMAAIVDFFMTGKEILNPEDNKEDKESSSDEGDDDVVKQIKELIEIKVRPAVAMDGGDIVYRDFKDGIVSLELKGSCSGCPSSTITLKNGIESMLKHYIPEVESVEQINEGEEY